MNKLCSFGKRVVICAYLTIAASTGCAWAQSAQVEVEQMAGQLKALMEQLSTRTEEFPPFIAELEQGLVNIEQAQERVAGLIANLEEAIKQMEDDSAFDQAIDAYKVQTLALIAEAEASNNDAIKLAIAGLQETLDGLEADDRKRSATVVEARNLLRTLEQNDEALVFFMKADQVQLAAQSIRANLDEFASILENGKVLAESILDGVAQ